MYAEQQNDEVTPRCEVYQAAPAHSAPFNLTRTSCQKKAYPTRLIGRIFSSVIRVICEIRVYGSLGFSQSKNT